MVPRWMQETGLSSGLASSGPPNGNAAKAAGAGIALLLATMKTGISSVMPWAVFGLWAMWMVLGLARAMASEEEFCANKAMGGAWKLVGATAIWVAALMGEAIVAEQGQSVPLATGVLGFVAVSFGIKAADAASYFFPGIKTVLEKIAPHLFARPQQPPNEESRQ